MNMNLQNLVFRSRGWGCMVAVLVSVLFCSVFCRGGDPVDESGQGAEWRIFRGDRRLSGCVTNALPPKMKLSWSAHPGGSVISSPVIADECVFVATDEGALIALGLSDGRKIWGAELTETIEAPPVCVDDTVCVGGLDGVLYAVDAKTGKTKWTYATDFQIKGSANWCSAGNSEHKYILVGSYDNHMHCLDASSGKPLWKYETENYINGAPAVVQRKAVFGGCDGMLRLVSVDSGNEQGKVDVGSYIAASVAVSGKMAYFGDYSGKVTCVDLNRMSIKWEYTDGEKSDPFFASPAAGENRLVIGSRDGILYCLSSEDGRPLWKFAAREGIEGAAVICLDKVIVGSLDGRLHIIRLSDGTESWSHEIGEPLVGSPAVAAGKIVVVSDDGGVFAFAEDPTR